MSEPIDVFLSKLEGVRRVGQGAYMARCPAHQDRTASLSIREAADGRVLIYDFGGCGAADVVLAAGLDLADLFPPRTEISYRQTRLRDPDIPRLSAAEALKLLDEESFFVVSAAEALAGGAALGEFAPLLSQAAARIAEIRLLWEMQP